VICRAEVFNALFEAAVLKEAQINQPSTCQPGSANDQQEREMRQDSAEREVIDLTGDEIVKRTQPGLGGLTVAGPSNLGSSNAAYPVVSYLKMEIKSLMADIVGASKKWTWGVDLTAADLRVVAQGVNRSNRVSQSGYELSLPSGFVDDKSSTSTHATDIEDSTDGLLFDNLSLDIKCVPSLKPHQFPVAFSLPALNRLMVNSDSEPDSVIRSFSKHALLMLRKTRMQEETEIPDSWSDHDTGVHRPLLPSSDPDYSPTRIPIPIQPGSDSVQSVNGMDVDDGFQPIPLGMLGISPDLITRQDDLSPVSGPRAPMVVVVSDSGDEADFYSDDSEGHQSDGELA